MANDTTQPADATAVAQAWLLQRLRPVRGWITAASIAGILASAAYAGFAAALASVLDRWSRSAPGHDGHITTLLMVAIPLALLARSVLVAVKEWAGARAAVNVRMTVRDELLDGYAALGPLRANAGNDGALASVLIEQVDALDGYVSRYRPQQFVVIAVPVLIAALVLPRSWLAALILLGTAPLIPIFMVLTGRQAAAASSRQATALANLGGQFLDLVRGLRTLRLLGRVDAGARRLDEGAQDFRRRSMQVLRIAFLSSAVLELFASIAIAMVALYLGLALLGRFDSGHYGTPMTLANALFVLLLAPEFFAPLRQLGSDYHARAQALAAATAISAVLQRVPSITHATAPSQTHDRPVVGAPLIAFDQVSLRHADGRMALRDISFTVAAGERVLLRGASGSGKSSILALLAGFVSPTSGQVRINGIDIATLDRNDWWRQLAWLEQRPEWFAGSVRDNVLLGLDGSDEARLWRALDDAGLADDVMALPDHVDSLLGPAGSGWSGGQLQRIALARALARDAGIWLLDEPLAHLDADTAAALRHTLANASAHRCVVLASHDQADQHWVDRVLQLDHGRLVDGTEAMP